MSLFVLMNLFDINKQRVVWVNFRDQFTILIDIYPVSIIKVSVLLFNGFLSTD